MLSEVAPCLRVRQIGTLAQESSEGVDGFLGSFQGIIDGRSGYVPPSMVMKVFQYSTDR